MEKIFKKWNYKQNLYSKTEWYRYYGEYDYIIKILFEKVEQSQVTVITLPVLFLIRHTLELGFKTNLIELEKLSTTKSTVTFSGRNAHILHSLHDEFTKLVREIFYNFKIPNNIKKEFETRNDELKKFRKIFDSLDNWSYSFRYPVESDGVTKSFNENDEIIISDILKAYFSTSTLLRYTTDVIFDYIENKS